MSGLTEIVPPGSLGDPSRVTLGGAVGVEALVHPGSDAEVADVVRWAGQEGLTVLPVGTGAHLHRVVTAERAVVTRTDRLAGIRIYEPADLTLTAGAGTPLSGLRTALAPHDQWLPFDPPDVDGRTLGGWWRPGSPVRWPPDTAPFGTTSSAPRWSWATVASCAWVGGW